MVTEVLWSRMATVSMSRRIAAALALILLLTFGVTARKKAGVTGFYSNMQYIKEAGDVIGMEVWIVYARGNYWATVQLAQGAPDPPVVVPMQVSGQRVGFSIPEHLVGSDGRRAPDLVLKFDGIVTGAALTGVFGEERVTLKRGNSYWQ